MTPLPIFLAAVFLGTVARVAGVRKGRGRELGRAQIPPFSFLF